MLLFQEFKGYAEAKWSKPTENQSPFYIILWVPNACR